MSDEVKDKLNKPLDVGKITTASGLTNFAAKPSIHSRIAAAEKIRAEQAATAAKLGGTKFINFARIMIFPDSSGSMGSAADDSERSYARAQRGSGNFQSRLDMLKLAVDTYLQNCNPSLNVVGVASFPEGAFSEPTPLYATIRTSVAALEPNGGTPMHDAMGYCIESVSFNHGVLISDGCPDNSEEVLSLAKLYKTKNVTCDAVHIGSDRSGESLMKQVAEITGGAYIKFTDVASFAKSFSYLAPAKRGILSASKNPVALLGAADVKL